jgi:hypothetical protein
MHAAHSIVVVEVDIFAHTVVYPSRMRSLSRLPGEAIERTGPGPSVVRKLTLENPVPHS